MDIQTLAHETVRAESDARAANDRALRALVDLVRPVAGVIAKGRSAVLVARKGKARELAWRRQRLAQALTAVSQPAGHRA